MPTTVTECAQELVKTYNEMMSRSLTAAQAGWEQAAAATKTMAEATQAEGDAAGKIWERTIAHSRDRTEKMAELSRSFAVAPASGVNGEAKEIIDGIVSSDQEFFKSCAEYALNVERRRASLATEMMRTNADLAASGQEVVQSVFDYGRALMDWSFAVTRGAAPTAPF